MKTLIENTKKEFVSGIFSFFVVVGGGHTILYALQYWVLLSAIIPNTA